MSKINKPLFFKGNRVRRIYTGGARFAEFCGDNSTEGFFPEEWVCSSVKALNEGSDVYNEGISQLESGEYWDEFLKENTEDLLGADRQELGVLVKLLDSSIRLPVQCHPDKEFSRKNFNSEYGKTECWVILATGEDAAIYFGFNKEYSMEEFRAAFSMSEEKLVSMLNKYPVKPGDVFLIPGRAIHAIGKNCMLLEVQEPTDFTIQPEDKCGDYVLSDNEKYLGLDPDVAFSCFDLSIAGYDHALSKTKCTPKRDGNVESLVTYNDTPCFAVNRYYATEEVTLPAPAIYVVTSGSGKVTCDGYDREVKRGEYFFAPASINGKLKAQGEGLELVQCCLPKKD